MKKQIKLKTLSMILMGLVLLCSGRIAAAENSDTFAIQGDVAFFKDGRRIGLQTVSGTVLHAAEFDGAGYFDATQQASVYIGDKVGRIDRSGNMIVEPFECDSIEAIPTDLAEENAPHYVLLVTWYNADGQKTMRLMNMEGEWLSETKFDLMMYEFHNGKLFIRYDNQFNQIDAYGQLTSQTWWKYLFVDSGRGAHATEPIGGDGLYFTQAGDLWAQTIHQPTGESESYLVSQGQTYRMPETWSNFERINDDFFAYCENNLWGIADSECHIVIPAQ